MAVSVPFSEIQFVFVVSIIIGIFLIFYVCVLCCFTNNTNPFLFPRKSRVLANREVNAKKNKNITIVAGNSLHFISKFMFF